MNDPAIFAALSDNRCPDCNGSNWRPGPRGGLAQNIECRSCLARFNVTRFDGTLVFAERITKHSDGGPAWSDLAIRSAANITAKVLELASAIADRTSASLAAQGAPVTRDVCKHVVREQASNVLLMWLLGEKLDLPSYVLADDGSSITCLVCGTTSYNVNDVEKKYCGRCHRFHEAAA
jgi:hypothetical protein